MGVIKPKNKLTNKMNFQISKESAEILKQYAMYTGYGENELIDMILNKLLFDNEFRSWANERRDKKKILGIIDSAQQSGLNLEQGSFFGNMMSGVPSTNLPVSTDDENLFSDEYAAEVRQEICDLEIFKEDE